MLSRKKALVIFCGTMLALTAGNAEGDARRFYTEFGDSQPVKVYIDKFHFPSNWIIDTDTCYDDRLNLSGWDEDSAGGLFDTSYSKKCLYFTDSNDKLPVSLKKQFEAATFGVLKLTYAINITNYADGYCWTLTDDGKEAMSIITDNGYFCLKRADGRLLQLSECIEGTEYAFKIDTDIDNKTIDVNINGVFVAKNERFANDVSQINTLSIESGRETVGKFSLYPVSLSRGYVIKESFDVQVNDELPEPWENTSDKGKASCKYFEENVTRDSYRMLLDSKNGNASATYRFDKLKGKYILDYKQYIKTKRDGVSVAIKNGDKNVFSVETKGGKFVFKGKMESSIYEYLEDFWYRIRVVFDMENGKADIYVNGKLKASGLAINAKEGDSIVFSALKNSDNDVEYDDILLYPYIERDDDYVEEPVIPKKKSNDVLVGMQACSLWKEGTQCGWELVSHYPLRVPYLGYYDEGNPEVSDWEIKWMLEHGIDFEWLCWYRPKAEAAAALKTTEHSESIHDGLFYSKYGDMMKFAIFYENMNSSYGDMEDFKTHIVPYWIEYFFKDDRYLKIDNRPVIGVFGFDKLLSSLGGEAGVKSAFQYLKEKCEENGIGEPIWVLSTFDTWKDNFGKYSSAGFDFIYSYHRSTNSMGQLRSYLQHIKNNGDINVIPSIAVGYNGRAWGENTYEFHYGIAYADEYADVCNWVNDEYLPTLDVKGISKKLVMIDTWNELGEGTYVMPTKLSGFDYLDAVRNAFTVGGEHADVVPTDRQKDRINNLYPDIMQQDIHELYTEKLIPTGIAAQWLFADAKDAGEWKATQDISEFEVKDGKLKITLSGPSPYIEISNFNMDVTDVPYIKFRVKDGATARAGRIEFIKDGAYLSDQMVWFRMRDNAKDFEDIYIPIYKNKGWTGVIDSVRICLVDNPYYTGTDTETIEFEEIAFLSGDAADTVAGVKYRLDGTIMECSNPEPVCENGTLYVPLIDLQKMFNAILRWDGEMRTTYIVKDKMYSISMQIDDDCIYLNGEKFNGVKGAIIHNDRTYVPIEIFGAMGYDVEWDSEENTVSIDTVPERVDRNEESVLKRKIIKSFEFNTSGNVEGWKPIQQITDLQAKNGILSGNIHGTDPYMELKEFEGFEADSIKNIAVRYQNNTEAPLVQILFKTDTSGSWTATKALNIDVPKHQSEYSVYNIDPSSNPEWTGRITGLRFDPAGWTTGGFKVDYIRFEGDFYESDTNKYELPEVREDGSDITVLQNAIKWNFDTNDYVDGWELNKGLGNIDVNQGYMTMKVVGNTPAMRTRCNLNIDSAKIRSIGIKLKNKTASQKARLYFTTDKKQEISKERCVEFDIVPDDPIGKLYIIKTAGIAEWKDTIKNLRLEFDGEEGDIVLEYIKLNFYK